MHTSAPNPLEVAVVGIVDERPMKIMEPAVNKLKSVSERLNDF